MNIKQSIITGIKWSSLSTFIVNFLIIIQYAILARLLAPSDFGLIAIVTVVAGFLHIFADLGISNAIIHKQITKQDILSTLFITNYIIGVLLCIIISAFSYPIAVFYQMPDLKTLISLASLSFIFFPLGQIHRVLLQKELNFNTLSKIEIFSAVIAFLTSTFFAFQDFGAYSIIFGNLASSVISSLLLFVSGREFFLPRFKFSASDIKPLLHYGFFQMGDRITNYVSWNIDKLIIGKFLGSEILGFYNLAFQLIIKPITFINPIINKIALPVFAKIQNDLQTLNKTYIKQVEIITFLTIPIYMCGFTTAEYFIPLLYGSGWDMTITVFKYFCFVGIIWSIGNPLGSLLLATGKVQYGFIMNIIGLFVYILAVTIGSMFSIMHIVYLIILINIIIMLPLDYGVRYFVSRMPVRKHIASYSINFLNSIISMGIMIILLQQLSLSLHWMNFLIVLFLFIILYIIFSIIFNRALLLEIKYSFFNK